MAELICIVCPKGCHLNVDEKTYDVTGNSCEKGAEYGKTELKNPTRTLTTTVRIENGTLSRCPVRTGAPIPKEKMFDAMAVLEKVVLKAPVKVGEVAVSNLLGTGVDVLVARTIE